METTAISFLVVYNIMLFQIKGFKDYIDMYVKHCVDDNGQPLKVVYEQVNDRWEVAVALSDKGFQQISFANSIATTKVQEYTAKILLIV